MFSNFSQKIEAHLEQNLPFVAYRKPNKTKVKGFLQNDVEVNKINDFTEEGFVFSPFNTSKPAILLKADEVLESNFMFDEKTDISATIKVSNSNENRELHLKLIGKGINEIKHGTFKKVVLSRVVKEKYRDKPFIIFKKILETYPSAFCYMWFHPRVGMWLGATPETLIKVENGRLVTNSLAGTQLYENDLKPVWGRKEKEEQQLVTEYILSALEDSVTDITVSETESVKAGTLLHLKTKISAKIKKDSLHRIIPKLHPTPAVCGLPKLASEAFILENENYNREYYTGFLGELNVTSKKERTKGLRNIENKAYQSIKKSTELYVNLRCTQLKEDTAHIYVGGGITKDSDAEKEWEETVNKSATMLKVIS